MKRCAEGKSRSTRGILSENRIAFAGKESYESDWPAGVLQCTLKDSIR